MNYGEKWESGYTQKETTIQIECIGCFPKSDYEHGGKSIEADTIWVSQYSKKHLAFDRDKFHSQPYRIGVNHGE